MTKNWREQAVIPEYYTLHAVYALCPRQKWFDIKLVIGISSDDGISSPRTGTPPQTISGHQWTTGNHQWRHFRAVKFVSTGDHQKFFQSSENGF